MRPRSEKAQEGIGIALTCLLAALYVISLCLWQERFESVGKTLMIVLCPFRIPFTLGLVAFAVVGFLYSIWMLVKKVRFGLLLLLVTLVSPIVTIISFFDIAVAHQAEASVRDIDGKEYFLLVEAFLQGSDVAICQRTAHGLFRDEYVVLARSPWEQEAGFLSMVRPKGLSSKPSLAMTSKRVLIALPGGNQAFAAYDLKSGRKYGSSQGDGEVAAMAEISPFALLSPRNSPNESDFKELFVADSYGRPDANAVKPDLQNANPAVRQMAAKLLKDLAIHPRAMP